MNENIIQVSLNEMRVKGILYQYDTGQKIQFLEDVAVGTHVLFSNNDIQKSKRKVVENNMVNVPNEVLKTRGTLTVDVQIVNENSETTVKTVKILVRNRKEAEDVITPDNEQTFIEQIQAIMTETKEIAQSAEDKATDVENRANDGEFNGKDGEPGPQGPVGPPGESYNLTDADKQDISNSTKDKVLNEIQPTLDEKVPQSRKIGNVDLQDDITLYELGGLVTGAFAQGGSWYSTLVPWLQKQCGTENIEILQENKADKWNYIGAYDMTGVKLIKINEFEYDELMMVVDGALSDTNSSNLAFHVFDKSEKQYSMVQGVFANRMSNTSARGFRLTLERLKESGIVLASLENLTYTNSLVLQNDEYMTSKICALWVQNTSSGETGFTAGTIHLYGR